MPSGKHMWSTTAANNGTADSGIDWAEGMAPSAVNNSARAQMSVEAKHLADNSGTLTTAGTSTAYTVTTNTVFTTLALLNGQSLTIKFNATNGAAPTLNVDGLGAVAIEAPEGTAIPVGMIVANSIWRLTYDNSNSAFVLQNTVPLLVTTLTALTAPAVDDELPIYDLSTTTNKKITLSDFFKVLTLLTAETAPATDDEIALYNTSSTATHKMTLGNLLKVVNALTEDTAPDPAADFILSYDNSATAAKKVKLSNVTGGIKLLRTIVASNSSSVDFVHGASGVVLDDTYDDYLFEFNCVPSTDDVALYVRVGTGAGPTYQETAYTYAANLVGPTGVNGGLGSTSDTLLTLTSSGSGVGIDSASAGCRGWVKLSNPEAAIISLINFQCGWAQDTTPALRSTQGVGCWGSTTAITAIRFAMTSGNVASGRFTLYGLNKS
jgi:hypothetical protein